MRRSLLLALPMLSATACGSAASTASTTPVPASSPPAAATASPTVVPATASADQLDLEQVGPDLATVGYDNGPLTQVVPDPCATSGGTFTARLRALGSGKPLAVSVVFSPVSARTPGSHPVSPPPPSPTAASPAPATFIGVRLASVDEGGAATDDAVSSTGTVTVDASGTAGRLDVHLVTIAQHSPVATLSGPWSCTP